VIREDVSLLPPFLPPKQSARWTTLMLIVTMVVAWVGVGINLNEVRDLFAAARGEQVMLGSRIAQIYTNWILLFSQLALLGVAGTSFILWLYQVRANLRAFGARRMDYGRQWCVLGFVIPGLNFYRPYQVMAEIWQASAPQNLDPFDWRNVAISKLVPTWWGVCLACAGFEFLALLTSFNSGLSLPRLQVVAILNILADTSAALACCLTIFMVSRVSHAQLDKWDKLESRGLLGASSAPA